MTKQEFARKYAVWCWGKVIPNDLREIESFMLRFLKEKKVKSVEIKQVTK